MSMILEHVVNLPRLHARAILNQTPSFEVRAFFRALRQLPEALRQRFYSAGHYVFSDREALARSQKDRL